MSDGPGSGLGLSDVPGAPLAFVHDTPACRVVLAPGALSRAAPEALRHGSRVMMITSEAAREQGDVVAADLGGAPVAPSHPVLQPVPVEQAAAAVPLADQHGVDPV